MLYAIVNKYGLVQKDKRCRKAKFPPTQTEMVSYMTEKAAGFACTLREALPCRATKEELAKRKEMMQIVYNIALHLSRQSAQDL